MKVLVISDTHDNIWNLRKVLKQVKGEVEMVIHCGDVVAPFTSNLVASTGLPTYICLGNNDEDHLGMERRAGKNVTWIPVGKQFGEIKIGKRKIAFTHYPKLGELLAKTNEYDAVFYGHTHFSDERVFGKTLLLNPGAVCGIQNGKPGVASYAIYDSANNKARIIKI